MYEADVITEASTTLPPVSISIYSLVHGDIFHKGCNFRSPVSVVKTKTNQKSPKNKVFLFFKFSPHFFFHLGRGGSGGGGSDGRGGGRGLSVLPDLEIPPARGFIYSP